MKTQAAGSSKMRLTQELGAEFWNDSCALDELSEAVREGAVGATSNPVIVLNAASAAPETWTPFLDELVGRHPDESEELLAWRLISEMGRRAAALLAPVHAQTKGAKGLLCVQVNPQLYRSSERMLEQGRVLAALAPNVAVKVPATEAGVRAMEELVAEGISVNATVSFTVSQAVAIAEAFERGLRRAEKAGKPLERIHPYVTIMVGRVDDQMRRAAAGAGVSEEAVSWAGIAVFKRAFEIFQEKKFRSTLLAAAYRHEGHWSQLIGEGVILSMPYKWWKQFNGSATEPARTLSQPVEARILRELQTLADFRKAHEPGALTPADFGRYGASIHTLGEFLEGYQKLLALVRARMLR